MSLHWRKGAAGVLQQLLLLLLPQSKSCSSGAGGAAHIGGVFLLTAADLLFLVKIWVRYRHAFRTPVLNHDVPKDVGLVNSCPTTGEQGQEKAGK